MITTVNETSQSQLQQARVIKRGDFRERSDAGDRCISAKWQITVERRLGYQLLTIPQNYGKMRALIIFKGWMQNYSSRFKKHPDKLCLPFFKICDQTKSTEYIQFWLELANLLEKKGFIFNGKMPFRAMKPTTVLAEDLYCFELVSWHNWMRTEGRMWSFGWLLSARLLVTVLMC